MPRFRKMPIEIDAVQWTGSNQTEVADFMDWTPGFGSDIRGPFVAIKTLEGTMHAELGDWIIKGIKGEFYPCKPDIFENSYEASEQPESLPGIWSNPYRERAALIAHLAAIYPSAIVHNADPETPGWPVIFIHTPQGQLSWHLAADDLDLFRHVSTSTADRWDGHTTDEKYERLAALTRAARVAGTTNA